MQKIIYSLFIFTTLFLGACSEDAQEQQSAANKTAPLEKASSNVPEKNTGELELAWEISGFKNPESVIYDEVSDILFVSNVNGSPVEKDGNGYISKVLLDGTVLSNQWVIGLNAPKGLAIYDGTLYVADIDTLVVIDIASGTISNSYQVDDAKFLNEFSASKLESALVIGVSTDILFPPHQQRELKDLLGKSGIETIHHEIDCPHGHDAFLIDEDNFCPVIKSYLDSLA